MSATAVVFIVAWAIISIVLAWGLVSHVFDRLDRTPRETKPREVKVTLVADTSKCVDALRKVRGEGEA